MHPVIRIVCYLVAAVFLARANAAQLLFSALVLGALLFVARPPQFLSRLLRALYRLKWLFLSMLVLYWWFTPAVEAGAVANGSALAQGAMRVAILVLLIWGVFYVLSGLSREQLLGAIYYLLQPGKYLGLRPKRLALRLTLTLQAVNELQSEASPARDANEKVSPWQRIVNVVDYWFDYARRRAEQIELQPQTLPPVMQPPYWQWALPLLLIAAFVLLRLVQLPPLG